MEFLRNLFGLRRGFVFDWRLLVLIIPALVVLSTDLPILLTLGYALSAILLVVALAHFARRILFPYLDLEVISNRAVQSPAGAGLVFLGTALIILAVILGTAVWIAH
jgi:hypothetical protein